MDIYAAIILGVFILAGIILHNWLRSGRSLDIKKLSLKGVHVSSSLNWPLFAIFSIGYITFTTLLFTSGAEDQESSVLFLFNVSALIIGGILAGMKKASLSKVYAVAASIQAVIFTIMLIKGYGDTWIVVAINTSIVVVLGLLAWLNINSKRINA